MNPTIVLVHGAFADGSSWNGVIQRLQQQGYIAVAPANPLRGVTADSAYLASLLGQINGPVLLAGHSYAEGEGSQVIMISQPQAVTDHILKAACTVSRS
jgi:pimeloyl-ACP methyl ester carboxylesterase